MLVRNNSVTAAGSESNSSRARLSPSKRLFRPSTRRLHALISFSTAATSFRSRSLDSETREDLDAILEFPVDAEEEAARYLVSSLKGSGGQKRANERREGHYELLTTIDGIGPRSAAACIVGGGRSRAFSERGALASYVDVVPGLRQSGKRAFSRSRSIYLSETPVYATDCGCPRWS